MGPLFTRELRLLGLAAHKALVVVLDEPDDAHYEQDKAFRDVVAIDVPYDIGETLWLTNRVSNL